MFLANKLNKGGSLAVAPDPQFNYVTMLLHGDGTNGAQNNTFLDSSTNNFTITRNGNTTQGSFSPYGSNWSNYFDGSTSFINTSQSAVFTFDANFTVEFWVYISTSQNSDIVGTANNAAYIGSGNSGWIISYYTSGGIKFGYQSNNSWVIDTTLGMTPTQNTWNHIAVVRSGSTITGYLNGVAGSTPITSSATFTSNLYGVYVGAGAGNNNVKLGGNVSNLRVIKGTAVYTSAFTPPTSPLTAISGTSLLTCQSNRFIDNSTNAFAITVTGTPSVERFNPFGTSTAYSTSVIGGSGYFDGSGDYLVTPSNSAFNFGTGDFQIEAWVYVFNVTDRRFIYGTGGSGIQNQFWIHTDRKVGYYDGTDRFSTTAIELNSWNQVALARSGSTCTFYVNGVSSGTFTSSVSLGATSQAYIGSRSDGFYQFTGYMSDLRILKGGTSVPSGNPTTPLTNITNTSLLFNYTNGAIFDNAMINDLETADNAQISTSVKKYGTGSMFFDGAGDFLTSPASPQWIMSGDWTIECWIYPNTVSGVRVIVDTRNRTTNTSPVMYTNGTNLVIDTGAASVVSAGTITASTWQHIAATRSGNSWRIFINGTQVGSTTTNTTSYSTAYGCCIGSSAFTEHYHGYIDDLRITKGYARYTANFTAPTAAFPNTGPV